jgi:hypothetical protein
MTTAPDYITDDAAGTNWQLMLGDSCERLAEVKDDSIDLAIYSPPFASLFTYSPSVRDLGNSSDRAEFFAHYGFIISEMPSRGGSTPCTSSSSPRRRARTGSSD